MSSSHTALWSSAMAGSRSKLPSDRWMSPVRRALAPRDAILLIVWETIAMRLTRLKSVMAARLMIDQSVASQPRLDHVQIAAPQACEAEARTFYGRLLGLNELPKPASLQRRGGVWFAVGDQQLHIGV